MKTSIYKKFVKLVMVEKKASEQKMTLKINVKNRNRMVIGSITTGSY